MDVVSKVPGVAQEFSVRIGKEGHGQFEYSVSKEGGRRRGGRWSMTLNPRVKVGAEWGFCSELASDRGSMSIINFMTKWPVVISKPISRKISLACTATAFLVTWGQRQSREGALGQRFAKLSEKA